MKEYKTTNLGLAAYLNAVGHSIEAIDKTDPKRAQFVFIKSDILDENIDEFFKRSAMITPLKLLYSLSELKHRIHN